MIGRGQQLLMADADGATRISDLAKLEDALKQLNTPGGQLVMPCHLNKTAVILLGFCSHM